MSKFDIEKLFRESVSDGETIWLEESPAQVDAVAIDSEHTKISFIKRSASAAEPAYLRSPANCKNRFVAYLLWTLGLALLIFAVKNFVGL